VSVPPLLRRFAIWSMGPPPLRNWRAEPLPDLDAWHGPSVIEIMWHVFPRVAGHHGTETYHALIANPTSDQPCDFAGGEEAANVWVCQGDRQLSGDAQRMRGVKEHEPSSSASVACSGSLAITLLGPKVMDTEVAILACGVHTTWLCDHIYIDGVYSGVMARRASGSWRSAFVRAS
jgi:hypothetical protein